MAMTAPDKAAVLEAEAEMYPDERAEILLEAATGCWARIARRILAP